MNNFKWAELGLWKMCQHRKISMSVQSDLDIAVLQHWLAVLTTSCWFCSTMNFTSCSFTSILLSTCMISSLLLFFHMYTTGFSFHWHLTTLTGYYMWTLLSQGCPIYRQQSNITHLLNTQTMLCLKKAMRKNCERLLIWLISGFAQVAMQTVQTVQGNKKPEWVFDNISCLAGSYIDMLLKLLLFSSINNYS